MRNIREVLRLRLQSELSIRQIQASTKISIGSIQRLLAEAQRLGLTTWPLPEDITDARLATLFYPNADTTASRRFVIPEWPSIDLELRRKGVSKQLLWEEYAAQHPNRCYSYSQFCDRYRNWKRQQKRSMRQNHKAGEKCFIDYSGKNVPIVDPTTGEFRTAQVFVAVLGASNFTYAEATWTQSLPDWLASHVRLFEYCGGVCEILVPDNLRAGVSRACRYDPDINPAYQQLAEHYSTAVIPARPYRAKDKAKAEVGVQIVQRWILARLRHHTFFSLAELNQCIRTLLDELNDKPFKQLPGTRRTAFERIDRPALKPLPAQPYRYVDIKTVKVNIDYHVLYDHHLYSVPHQYVGKRLELHASDTLVVFYFQHVAVASHPRILGSGTSTEPNHMPTAHQKHHRWTPERIKSWAADVGEHALTWVNTQMAHRDHPEQAFRACLGLLNMTREYGNARVNAACGVANAASLRRLKQVRNILASNRDQLPEQLNVPDLELPQDHRNIRGPGTFY